MAPKRKQEESSSSRPPPGGFHQKRKWADSQDSMQAPQPRSELAKLLVEKWAWGEMSTPAIQQIAAAAVADGATSREVTLLAGLGSNGRYPNHMHTELLKHLQPTKVSGALTEVDIAMKRPPHAIVRMKHPMLLPHELFATIYTHHRDRFFEVLCGGSEANIEQFWAEVEGTQKYASLPARLVPTHKKRCIPIAIHGDGVPISGIGKSWSKSAQVFSWCSLLARGSTINTCFLIYLFFWQLIVSSGGMDQYQKFTKMLCWSLTALSSGKWPRADAEGRAWEKGSPQEARAGKPLADGFFCCVYLIKGDLEFMAKAFGLAWASSNSPCSLCECNTTNTPWTDGRREAAWRNTIWKPGAWAAQRPERHLIFKLPGVSILSYVPDILHTLHLGTYQYVFGSVLKLLTHHILQGRLDDNLERVWMAIKQRYKDYGVSIRFNDLRLSMYTSSETNFPSLKGKAAEIRHLAKPLASTFESMMDPGDAQHKQVRALLQSAVQLEELLGQYKLSYRFPDQAAQKWNQTCFVFVQLNTALGNYYHSRGIFLFHNTVKFHYMLHTGLLGSELNPRVAWCYAGEDMMHRVKMLVQRSHFGTPPPLLIQKTMLKYAQGLGAKMAGCAFKP